MPTNFQNLDANQIAVSNKIITFGRAAGYSDDIISSVLHVANQESSLGRNRLNPASKAEGIFQFLPGSDSSGIKGVSFEFNLHNGN